MPAVVAHVDPLSPAPILEAVERYRGTFVDLDAARVYAPDEFCRAREALVAAVRRAGLRSGDRVVMAIANGPLFVAALAAILAAEGSPLLVHAKTPPAELARYARRFGATFLASEPAEAGSLMDFTSRSVEMDFAGRAAFHWSRFDTPDGAFAGPLLPGIPLHPTSGSTGLPKIALRPAQTALEEARHYAETMAIDADDTIMAIPPMSHAYGYGLCVMVPLLTGASIVSTRRFSVKSLHRVLAEHAPTILPFVPTTLDVLSASGGANLRPVRWVLTAGAVLTQRSAEQFRAKTGITPCPLYGTTETGGISVAVAGGGRDIDGRVGAAMNGVEVEVRPTHDFADLEDGAGKLFVRSSSLMTGYLDEHGQMRDPTSGGWFETGDLARIDSDGTIHLRGRDSEVLNVFGLKVVPCEVEEAIAELPGVTEVKVYGAEHSWGGQMVKAAVAARGDLSEAHVRAHCERQLVYYKRPQMITLVDALPRTPTGKIDRYRLP